ncbi:MAG: hypothetical protein KBC69_01610 [Candidatus Magasanikbacteria bacterium]|nr:hypothetical protein [Candidatus Magasanikbacteria bacterium]
MFGKKILPTSEKTAVAMNVQTIPADFYGGVNPVVKFKKVEKEIVLDSKPKLSSSEKKMLDESTAVGSGADFHAVNIFTNRKYALIFWLALFLIIGASASAYYYWQARSQQKVSLPPAPQIEVPSSTTPVTVQTTTPDLPINTSTDAKPQVATDAPIDFPSNLLGDSPDLDRDGITDVAEDLFGTDPSKPDTDEDSYDDGHEVFYLYNPGGKEPMRLVESGSVKEYENGTFGYKVFYPNNWAVGSVDESSRQVLFSTITGENIEIRTFDLSAGQNFNDWFNEWAPNEKYQNIKDFQTKFFEPGKSRADNLVYYFVDANHVYVLIYHTTDSNVVNYRSVLVMMARSFRGANFIPPQNSESTISTGTFPSEMPASVN